MKNSKFYKTYIRIINEQMQNLPGIKNNIQKDLKEDYMIIVLQTGGGLTIDEFKVWLEEKNLELHNNVDFGDIYRALKGIETDYPQGMQAADIFKKYTSYSNVDEENIFNYLEYLNFLDDEMIRQEHVGIPMSAGGELLFLYMPQDLDLIKQLFNLFESLFSFQYPLSKDLTKIEQYFKTRNREILGGDGISYGSTSYDNYLDGNPSIMIGAE